MGARCFEGLAIQIYFGSELMRKWLSKMAALLSVLVLVLSGVTLISTMPTASAAPTYGTVSVQGTNILVDGQTPANKFFGVVDTTALQFAVLTYIDGQTQFAGKTSVFNGPDTGDYSAVSPNDTPAKFFDRYFALLAYYHCNLVRIGAGDSWGTGIMYDAWVNHHDAFVSLLLTMEAAAEAHDVWVVLVLAGAAEYPTYTFGGSGSVFNSATSAYHNYISYCRGVMASLTGLKGIAWYDVYNEPDHNACYANYWMNNGNKVAFHAWACSVADDTAGASSHPRSMGVAGLGSMFGWGQSDFDLCTGTVPFEIASRHYYASATGPSNTYLFSNPESWAKADGRPLYWGELGDNSVYPLIRYTFAEQAIFENGGQAITSMVLTGTAGYPLAAGGVGVGDLPKLSIISPTNGAVINSTSTTVQWTGSAIGSGVSNYLLQVDSGSWTSLTSTTTSYALSGLTQGSHTVTVRAVDNAGSYKDASVSFVLDTVAPSITITSPSSGALLASSSVIMQWSARDSGTAIANYLVKLDNGSWTTVSASSNGYTFSAVADGAHTLYVRVIDNAGNMADASISVVVDTTASIVTIASPSSGSMIASSSVTVTWRGSDSGSGIANYLVNLDGGSWTTLSSTTSSYTFSGLAQGTHAVTVRAVDKAGNTKDASVSFVVDTVAPSITITSPTSGSTVASSKPTIAWTDSDASGIAYFQLMRDGGAWVQLASSTTSYTLVDALAQGSHTVTVRAVDNAGNYKDATVTFNVGNAGDITPPSVSITSPVKGASFTTTSVTVKWTGSDSGSGIAYYLVQVETYGSYWTQLASTTNAYTFNGFGQGTHTATVRAVDNAGNTKDTTVTFTVGSAADTTAPTVTITSPSNGASFASFSVTIKWTGSDSGSGLASYYVRLDNGQWTQLYYLTNSYTYNGLWYGSHTVTVRAMDKAGNVKDVSVTFIVK
jgi:hypothetical protein